MISRAFSELWPRLTDRETISETEQKFAVLGSTGNLYDVRITHIPTCSCPDFAKGHLCKHVIFVMLRVLKANSSTVLSFITCFLCRSRKTIRAGSSFAYHTRSACLLSSYQQALLTSGRAAHSESVGSRSLASRAEGDLCQSACAVGGCQSQRGCAEGVQAADWQN